MYQNKYRPESDAGRAAYQDRFERYAEDCERYIASNLEKAQIMEDLRRPRDAEWFLMCACAAEGVRNEWLCGL